MEKRIVLCADDYGQAPAISQGILKLLNMGRLSATSCMVNTLYWQEAGRALKPLLPKVDIGLHFNLTEGRPVTKAFANEYGKSLPSLSSLMQRAFLRRLKISLIEDELNTQLDRFQQVMGALPRFIDGHQHVHQFPIIRDALLNVYDKRLKQHHTYIRAACPSIDKHDIINNIKKIIIAYSGGITLKKALTAKHIPHNASFSGIYPFAKAAQYATWFQRFLQEVNTNGLIMCHPALANAIDDPIGESRQLEYRYFASDQFLTDCQAAGVVITTFC